MKKRILLANLFILALSLQSFAQKYIKPSGNVISKNYDLNGFDGIEISTDFKALVTISNETSVRIEADDNLHELLDIRVKDGHLVVRHKSNLNIRGKETLIAHISVPSLNYIDGSDDSVIELKNELKANKLRLNLSGDSMLNGDLTIGDMEVHLSGDSYLTINGKADKLVAYVKGDSYIKDYDFIVGDLDLDLSGDSMAKLTVVDNMDLNITGDSQLNYKGSPKTGRQIVRGDSVLQNVN